MGGRQPLGPVAFREGDEVGDLLAFNVDDLDQLAALRDESGAVATRDQDLPRTRVRR